MNNKLKISIALCTFNGARFLPAQLASFAQQTRPPDEIVVGDDCSGDETLLILEDFAKNADFPVSIRVNETNLGSTKNFEQTILRCTSDVIFLSDQDDVWLPEKIARIAAEFERDEAVGLVFTNAQLVDEDLNSVEKELWDYSFSPKMRRLAREEGMLTVLFKQSTVTGATMAFRRRFADYFVPIPTCIEGVIHDEWIALAVALQSEVVFIEKPLVKYRLHSSQQLGVIEKDEQSNRQPSKSYDTTLRWLDKRERKILRLKNGFLSHPICRNRGIREKVDGYIDLELEEIRSYTVHLKSRQNFSREMTKRAAEILREFQTGRYRRFSKGFLSAAKDFLHAPPKTK